MTRTRTILTLCAVLLLALTCIDPAAAQNEGLTIRITQVDNFRFPKVTVYVSVTGADGEPAPVNPGMIQLYENGVLVEPDQVLGSGETGPLTTLLVIDVSGSMYNGGKINSAKAAAKAYVAQMRPGDETGLISFNTQVTVVQGLTSDTSALNAAIDSLDSRYDTAMYDALAKAVEIMAGENGRKAIIVLTDGLDNMSNTSADDVITTVSPGGLSISTIGLGDPSAGGNDGLDEAGLRSLADQTGGLYGYAADAGTLQSIYETYGRALQSEYAITYTSPSALRDGVNRTLTVSLGEAGVSSETAYNPGGVLPEVSGGNWALFIVMLVVLVLLAFLPGILKLAAARKDTEKKPATAGKKKSRIKLK